MVLFKLTRPFITNSKKKDVLFIIGDGNEITIKRRLLLGRKVMTNLDSIFKGRDITLPKRFVWSRLWFFLWSRMDVRVGL